MSDEIIVQKLLGRKVPPTRPLGFPPGVENLIDDVEYLLELPHDDFLQNIDEEREFELDKLISGMKPLPHYRTFRPKRRWKDGQVIGFHEIDVAQAGPLSLSRPFDSKNKQKSNIIMGNAATGIPFLPGGMEVDLGGSSLTGGNSTIDWENLKQDPPGMRGMDFAVAKVEDLTLDDLVKQEIEDDSFKWVPKFRPDDDLGSSTGVIPNDTEPLDDINLEPLILADPVDPIVPEKALRVQDPIYMVNADKEIDIDKPWSELLPDPAYKWPFELDSFQKRAILCLEDHESVFVAAHTSAGKTVVAEYAIALAHKHMTRVIYTSPIKALSNQKFRDFRATFQDVGLLTGDCQIKPDAGCLIMTTEILRSMLYAGSDVIRDLEWVVFDEVHYINDAERGVVWEEVLIMLPAHVGLILLSATVPNIEQFASWVGRIKKRKIYVTSTAKRPVPLEHYLFTGNSTKNSDQLFKIVDQTKRFLPLGYKKAKEAKEINAKKSKKPPSEQAIWSSVIGCLKKRDGLPAVAFTLSRRRCDNNAAMLTGVNLTSPGEKNEIALFYRRCTAKLKPIDRKLPQVVHLEGLLERGLAVHHSGVLPILKETIELLFARGLVKLLFATETFAMGVNMPARSVLFDSSRKHDGKGMRELIPSEYIQMAGRAGRRGLDTFGTVILVQRQQKCADQQDLINMMLGKAAPLVSKFRLTYGMLLSILRVGSLRVEDIMLRSFIEFGRRGQPTQIKQLESIKSKKDEFAQLESKIEGTDFESYVSTAKELIKVRSGVMSDVFMHGNIKNLTSGRLVVIQNNRLAVILTRSTQNLTVLINKIPPKSSIYQVDVLINFKYDMDESFDPDIVTLPITDVTSVFKEVVKIRGDDILYDFKKRQIGSAANQAAMLLNKTASDKTFQPLNFIKDFGLNSVDQVEKITMLETLSVVLASHSSPQLPYFATELDNVVELLEVREQYKSAAFSLSEESLEHLPDYKSRVNLLRYWNYIGDHGDVQLKGRVACQFRGGNELLLTEMLLSAGLQPLNPAEVCAVLSSLVFQSSVENESELIEKLPGMAQEAILKMKELWEEVLVKEAQFGILSTDHDSAAPLKFGLCIVVYNWANGESFKDIMRMTDIQEGVIVRCIQRLEELCREVRNGARTVGDFATTAKMEQCSEAVKRDIVFAASLYTQG